MDEEVVDFSAVLRDYYLERASRVCSGVTADHYDRWKKWSEKNNLRINLAKFIQDLTQITRDEVSNRLFSWHWENGKRVDDHYEKIILKR